MEKLPGDEWKRATDGLDRGVRRKGQKSAFELEREAEAEEEEKKRPGHADFYKRYAQGFAPLLEKLSLNGEGEEKAAQ
jgi:hypothetical protein